MRVPVRESKASNPRSLAFAVGGLLIAVVLLLGLVFGISKATESGKIELKPGTTGFAVGNARVKAPLIAADGPFLFSDVANGQRDIFVQHLGDDPTKGWSAFDARTPGTSRGCTLQWQRERREFKDPCEGSIVPADGGSLPHYPVNVSADDQLSVDLRSDRGTTTTIPEAPPSTSGIIITS